MSDRSASITATSAILLVLLFIFVPARFAAREATKVRRSITSNEGGIGIDDWVALAAGVGSSLGCALLIAATHRGLGRHTDPSHLPAAQEAMQLIFADQIIYILVMSLTKTSQLLLYTRLWSTAAQKSFRVCCYGVMTVNAVITIFLIPFAITSCNPPHHFWTRITNLQQGGDCDNPKSYLYANTIMSIVLDAIVITMPVPMVAKLQMSTRKKIAVCALFGMGGVVIICSIMRATTVPEATKQTDPMWELAPTCLWSLIESCIGVICSCIPALNKPVATFFQKRLFRKDRHTSHLQRPNFAEPASAHSSYRGSKDPQIENFVSRESHSGYDQAEDIERGCHSPSHGVNLQRVPNSNKMGWEEFFLSERRPVS